MGCGASAGEKPPPRPAAQTQSTTPVEPIVHPRPGPAAPVGKFQIMLQGNWKDYDDHEDMVLKRAFLVGQPNARFKLRGQEYEYSFTDMRQRNLGTGKERKIRPPKGMKSPGNPLLPTGPMVVITVPPGSAGTTIEIPDPNNPGTKLHVNVPSGARPGQKMAVPVPETGQSVQDVQAKQKAHLCTGAKVAMGVGGVAMVAGVGGLAVGGVILGDHLSGGAVADAMGDAFGGGAGDAMGAATDWSAGVVGDVPDFAGDAGGSAIDWLGDAAGDAGDFVMNLF